jgi:hypothetical protein
MAEMESAQHFAGDDCAKFGLFRLVEFVRSDIERGMCSVSELQKGDAWRDPEIDSVHTWWYAVEIGELVAYVGDDADVRVHIKYQSAPDPHA